MDQSSSSSQPAGAPWNELGTFAERGPRAHSLEGVHVVSADNHICLGGADFWYENAPPHLKERVPRVWFDNEYGFWVTGFDGESLYAPGTEPFVKTMECHPGAWNIEARIGDLDAEGVQAEIAFPQNLIPILYNPDVELREYIFKEYGRYLADLQRRAPGPVLWRRRRKLLGPRKGCRLDRRGKGRWPENLHAAMQARQLRRR